MQRDDRATLFDIVSATDRITEFMSGLTEEAFSRDEKTKWAIFSQIVIIGEAANRLTQTFTNDHSDVSWSEIIGMRNRLVHGYDAVIWSRVWATVQDDVPRLRDQVKALLDSF